MCFGEVEQVHHLRYGPKPLWLKLPKMYGACPHPQNASYSVGLDVVC